MRRAAQLIAALAATFHVAIGGWAFAAPASFFATVAPYPPFNEHFLHDIGAFNLGLGAALVAGLLVADALTAVLSGAAVAEVVHEGAHVLDRLAGGHPSDPYTLGALALVVVTGVLAAARTIGAARTT